MARAKDGGKPAVDANRAGYPPITLWFGSWPLPPPNVLDLCFHELVSLDGLGAFFQSESAALAC